MKHSKLLITATILLSVFLASGANAVQFQAFNSTSVVTNEDCADIPTMDDVKKGRWEFSDKLYTAREAASVGIMVVNATASRNLMLVVKDYRRIKPCTTNDGKTEIFYGQVIRAVIEITEYDAELGINYAFIAASGTLNRKRQSFYIYKDGFFNTKIDEIFSSVSGKVFDVENYALYQNVMIKMLALLGKPETKFAVNKILVVPKNDKDYLSEAPLVAYSLYSIKKKRSCKEAQKKFSDNGAAVSIIERTYLQFVETCDDNDPSDINSLTAKQYLSGLKVR